MNSIIIYEFKNSAKDSSSFNVYKVIFARKKLAEKRERHWSNIIPVAEWKGGQEKR